MSNTPTSDRAEKKKMLELVREAISRDKALREKHQVGDKFRFVRDRLSALAEMLEKSLPHDAEILSGERQAAADEVLIYVYLYNAQGLQLRTWQNLLNPKVFYEYSVNRPIYSDKSHVEALLRTKTNKAQHAYLTVVVKSEYVTQPTSDSAKDIAGNPVIKVREGSLSIDNVISFTHQGQEYTLNEKGELVKK